MRGFGVEPLGLQLITSHVISLSLTLINRMRILLHYPRISLNYPTSNAMVARSVSQIIFTYSALASQGYLNPSWPQLKRITVCGQLLILLCSSGEVGVVEANNLLKILVELLDGHAALWPIVASIQTTYAQAATVLGESTRPLVVDGSRSALPSHAQVPRSRINGRDVRQWSGRFSCPDRYGLAESISNV